VAGPNSPLSTDELVAYGYRYGEVQLPKLAPIKEGSKISEPRVVDLNRRPVVNRSLGCHLKGYACPHPDPHDPLTTAAGVRKRFAFAPPKPKRELIRKLRKFVRSWLRKNLKPLPPESDTSIEHWLENTNYPAWRKAELLETWKNITNIRDPTKKYLKVKSFMKDEVYPEYKHARAINSRHDAFKCYVGPIFKLIEHEVYKNQHFIKHIPVADRPKYIMEKLFRPNATYVATDYTAFESLFTAELMEACEFELYDYMTTHLPQHDDFMGLCRDVLMGRNVCEFKHFVVEVPATRMSGEMCTSLGNGFSNLMFMLFMCDLVGCTDVEGVVEGDDGLFVMNGTPPSVQDFEELGLVIKLEVHRDLNTASFCGIIFDTEDKVNITDPRDVLATFGWCSARYTLARTQIRKALLRCKSLSYAYQYPGCPIIQSLAQYGLRMTRSIDIRRILEKDRTMSMWEREQLLEAVAKVGYGNVPFVPVKINTRLLVEQQFGITIEHQIMVEKYLDNLGSLEPLDSELLAMYLPMSWGHFYDTYVLPLDKANPDNPSRVWAKLDGFVKEW